MATITEKVTASWRDMDRGLRIAAIGAVVLAIAATVWGCYMLLHEDYGTLFSQLSDADAASIVDALKREKIPYRLSENGSTISVQTDRVHDTRLELMSNNVPLAGGVGFEIFDKQGLGATEQSQRVSYQRALQGELARTIAALENVKQVRVHLVLPESTLFKRDHQDATAAVTVTMKPGHSLDRQQIIGVQRLVAASVAGLNSDRVVISDQRGVTLSAADTEMGNAAGVEARLEAQRQIESHIATKIARLLDGAYGSGQAIISVAVALSFDAVKTTTQDLLPVRGSTEGGVVRKRQMISGTTGTDAAAAATGSADGAADAHRSNSTTEMDYEYGRKMEEVIASPGAIKRLTVGVIVPPRLGDEQQRRIRELVAVAAGIDEARGDIVSVQALGQVADDAAKAPISIADENSVIAEHSASAPKENSIDRWLTTVTWSSSTMIALVVSIAIVLILIAIGIRLLRSRSLSAQEREQLLHEIRKTLGGDARVTPMQVKP